MNVQLSTGTHVASPPPGGRRVAGEFFGDITMARDVAGLLLRESYHGPDLLIPKHEHEAAHFCMGVSGSCVERVLGRDVDCVPGTVEYHPAGTCHGSRWGESGGRCFTVTLTGDWPLRLDTLDRELHPAGGVLGNDARRLMRSMYRELRRPDSATELAVEGLLLSLYAAAARRRDVRRPPIRRRTAPRWFATVEELLRADASGSVRVDDIAKTVGVHPVLLARSFQRIHGVTIGEFVRTLRLERAASRLRTSADSIGKIAHECGFADHAHLTRAFRAAYGSTPSEYRRETTITSSTLHSERSAIHARRTK